MTHHLLNHVYPVFDSSLIGENKVLQVALESLDLILSYSASEFRFNFVFLLGNLTDLRVFLINFRHVSGCKGAEERLIGVGVDHDHLPLQIVKAGLPAQD